MTHPTLADMSREQRMFFALDDDGDGRVPEQDVRDALEAAGLQPGDPRLSKVYTHLDANGGKDLDSAAFVDMIGTAGLLVDRALRGELAVPDFANFRGQMEGMFAKAAENTSGKKAMYIPPLAKAEEERFGVAVVSIDGQTYTQGDADDDFSIQSMCKPFNYCFAVEELGAERVHQHVGKEPSGRRFDHRDLMERMLDSSQSAGGGDGHGGTAKSEIPYNPMINAGAIMAAALVKSNEPFPARLRHVREQWARLAGKPDTLPRFNKEMARQENFTGFNNMALGYLLMATGKLPKRSTEFPGDTCADPDDFDFFFDPAVENALKLYFSTCSLELTAAEMAAVAATLANGGVCPTTQERVLQQETVRSCLSLMQMCGMYDGSGDFCYTIGLPAKSGVGGGVILVVPRLMGICVFSPRLNAEGNSARGVEIAECMVAEYRLHLYDGVTTGGDRIDPRLPLARWRASQTADALWAAGKGDVRTLRRLHEEQVDLAKGDYDQRAPIHLAAAEGHVEALRFLLEAKVSPDLKDRWGGRPLNDAVSAGHTEAAELLRAHGAQDGEPVHNVDDRNPAHDKAADHGDDLAVVELLWAAHDDNIAGLRRLAVQGVPMEAQDYDKRTALHLAASEGKLEAVKYLRHHGHPLNVRDRWNATPLDEARREKRAEVVAYLEAWGRSL